jgi:hypothetical protein
MCSLISDLALFDPILLQTMPSLLACGVFHLAALYCKKELVWGEELATASGGGYLAD